MVRGKVRETCELIRVLEWAKPILAAALNGIRMTGNTATTPASLEFEQVAQEVSRSRPTFD